MPNVHFRYTVTPENGEPSTYAGPDVASDTTARKHLDALFPAGPRIQLDRYEMRSNTWRPVLVREPGAAAWTLPRK